MTGEEGEVIACHSIEEWNVQLQKAIDSKKLIVIDFTASWCGPCKFIAPFFADLAKKSGSDAFFFKVDVDELKEVANEYAVKAMPTFVFLKEGAVVETIVGGQKHLLEAKVAKHATTAA